MLKTAKKILDRSLEILVMVIMAALVVDVLLQVLVRLAPQTVEIIPLPVLLKGILCTGTEELATFLLIWVAILGSAVALNRGAHLGVDYFVGKLPEKARLFTEVIVFLCIALFSLFVMVVGGTSLVSRTLELGQISPALKIRIGYVYLALPISGFFLMLYSSIGLIERIIEFFKRGYTPQLQTSSTDKRASAI